MMEKSVPAMEMLSWYKPKQYFPKGSVAWGWLWLDSMAGGQAWVREVQLFF